MTAPFTVPPPAGFVPFTDEADRDLIANHFVRQVNLHPDRLALVDGARQLTYRALNEAVNRLAHAILRLRPGAEEPVILLFGREAVAVTAVLATLKTGKFYVGLEANSPLERLQGIVDDLQARLILTTRAYADLARRLSGSNLQIVFVDELDSNLPTHEPDVKVSLDSLAVIFYTSGSTGKPKGVMLDQRGLWYRNLSSVLSLKFHSGDRTCFPFSAGLGWSTTPLYGTLTTGGTLFICDYASLPGDAPARWFEQNKISMTPMPPAVFRQFINSFPDGTRLNLPDLRMIFVGGDTLSLGDLMLWQKLFPASCMLAYGYSSTEGGPVMRSFCRADVELDESALTFGTPAPGVKLLVLDESGRPVARGETGRIGIQSRGIMCGYWGHPDLSRTSILPAPDDPQEKVFVSGDFGRIHPNGNLEFVGRTDNMVKIRGARVQLEEVELAVKQLDSLRDATVIAARAPNGELRLVAYLVAHDGKKRSSRELRQALSNRLPASMLPSAFVWMDELPRGPLGKVARQQLPEPTNERPELDTSHLAPRNEIERQLTAAWQSLLGLDGLGVNDNFFELGGDSLLALRMIVEAEKILAQRVPQSFFSHATIANLAALHGQTDAPREEPNRFSLSASRRTDRPARQASRPSARPRLISRLASRASFDQILSSFVNGRIASRTYVEASDWAAEWSRSVLARKLFYAGRYAMFSRFVASLAGCTTRPEEVFPLNILANLEYGLVRTLGEDWRAIRSDIEVIQRSRLPYWRDLARLIAESSPDELEANFPVQGLEHVQAALASGRGAILLTFHGANSSVRMMALAKRLGMEAIPTISHRIPARQSEFGDVTDGLSFEVASSLNTEIALYAQRRLMDGQMINVVGDASDTHGRRYEVIVAGRKYQFKAGFAELALNTGAAIIPHFGSMTPDGKPQLNFYPPLEAKGDRSSQVEGLVAAYADFMTRVWTAHPEILWWTRIRRHFIYPPAGEL